MYFWTKGSKYYNAYIQPNFLGGSSVICSWGSYITNAGNFKVTPCENDEEVDKLINKIKTKRQYRGYKFNTD